LGKASSVLVTGGGGFIGSHIVDALLKRDIEVGVLDDFSTGETSNLPQHASSRLHLYKGDIRDEAFVRSALQGYEAIIHQAALVSVTRSVEDPGRTNSVNVDGTVNLLSAARDANIRRFVYASSSSVYGETRTQPKIETMNTFPISPYAVSKLAAENYCRVFASVYGMETVSLRYFNVYGPRQKYGPYSGVIPTFVKRVMNDEPPVIFGDGNQTRDFTYVEDVVSANLLSLDATVSPGRGEVFNVGSGRNVTMNQLASMVTKLMGRPELGVEYAPPRKGDILHSYSDISKAAGGLGYAPRFSLQAGLQNVIDWFVKGLPVQSN
jgi:nucleoside-diphosphate-sugar epimerase